MSFHAGSIVNMSSQLRHMAPQRSKAASQHVAPHKVVTHALPITAVQGLYSILGVEQQSDAAEIKAAYRKLAKQLHPDLHPAGFERVEAEEQLRNLNHAYEVLGDEHARAQYDAQYHFAQEAAAVYAAAAAAGSGTDAAQLEQLREKLQAAQDALAHAQRVRAMAQEARRASEAAKRKARVTHGDPANHPTDTPSKEDSPRNNQKADRDAAKAAKQAARRDARAARRRASEVRAWAQWAELEAAQAHMHVRGWHTSERSGDGDGIRNRIVVGGSEGEDDLNSEAELLAALEEIRVQVQRQNQHRQGAHQEGSKQQPHKDRGRGGQQQGWQAPRDATTPWHLAQE